MSLLPKRTIGIDGPVVGAVGLGCLNLTGQYGSAPRVHEAIATIDLALELGMNLFDTADSYGKHKNEEFLGQALRGRRDKVVLATKFGLLGIEGNPRDNIRGDRPYVAQACEASLSRLNTDYIDILYLHRPDPKVPIEETVSAMSDLVQAGKVRHLGLCEVSGETLRRAHAVHAISSLESEWSLWSRDLESGALPTARELRVGIVPFAPLGRGMLAGRIKSESDLSPRDPRRRFPRMSGENLSRNLRLVKVIEDLARARGCTAAQLVLAWLCAQGSDVVPIPGSDRPQFVLENASAADIQLSDDDLARLDAAFPIGVASGDRYPDMTWVSGVSPAPMPEA